MPVMVLDLAIKSCSLSSIVAVRIRSERMLSARFLEKNPTTFSHPVFDRMESNSLENPEVTSSRPKIRSAILLFINCEWACTSSRLAFSISIEMSWPDAILLRALSICAESASIFACAAATSALDFSICVSNFAILPSHM